jgi:heme exporter protein D
MTDAQSSLLAAKLAANWSPPKWGDVKFTLFAEALLPFDFAAAERHVQSLIETRGKWECPVVADVIRPLERKRQLLEDQRRDRKLLREPKDPRVKAILRGVIEKMEERARQAGMRA